MNDRPSPANGKRDVFWGTLKTCVVCRRCLCYGCHPRGPCADERSAAAQIHPPHVRAAGRPLHAHT
jgi:hypothetical protein